MKEFQDKIIMVTGAANGIGLELAEYFLGEGANVHVCDLDETKLRNTFSGHAKAVIHILDVREKTSWRTLLKPLANRLDILFNVAGVIRPGYLLDMEDADIDLQIAVNLNGVIYGTKYAAEAMEGSGGHIVNIASMAGLAPVSGIGVYTASKFGVRGFSLAMAQELAGKGIKVSVVAPDAVDTHMLDDQMDSDAAALTFSGSSILTVQDVRKIIVKEVLKGGKTEVWIPFNRGVQAYLGATFPKLAGYLTRILRAKGLRQQEEFRKNRSKR